MHRACHVGILGASQRTANRTGRSGGLLGTGPSDIRVRGRFRGYLAYSGESSPPPLRGRAIQRREPALGVPSNCYPHRDSSLRLAELAALEVSGRACPRTPLAAPLDGGGV